MEKKIVRFWCSFQCILLRFQTAFFRSWRFSRRLVYSLGSHLLRQADARVGLREDRAVQRRAQIGAGKQLRIPVLPVHKRNDGEQIININKRNTETSGKNTNKQ